MNDAAYYVVWLQVNSQWIPISRPYAEEREAQEWALNLDSRRLYEVRGAEW